MWKPAGCYSMTDVRCPGDRPRENRNATAGLRAGPLPARIPDRICGKKIVEVHQVEQGCMSPQRTRMRKADACDRMSDRLSGWRKESQVARPQTAVLGVGANRALRGGEAGPAATFGVAREQERVRVVHGRWSGGVRPGGRADRHGTGTSLAVRTTSRRPLHFARWPIAHCYSDTLFPG